jgi:long-subunit acyl-CoA synthetase (AMP-forming)
MWSFSSPSFRFLFAVFVECKIVNPENGQIQPHNVEGELHLRSSMVTPGYWNDPENTKKSIDANRWYDDIHKLNFSNFYIY